MSEYDIDLSCSGDGWLGTFFLLVRQAATDILSDGEPWPIEVTYPPRDDAEPITLTGMLTDCDGEYLFIDNGRTGHSVHIDAVLRFRA